MIFNNLLLELLPDCIEQVIASNEAARDIASRECDFTVRNCDNIPFHMFMNLISVNRRRKEMAKKVIISLGGEDAEERARRLRSEYQDRISQGYDEWIKRGLPASEYSIEALEAIWDKEKKEKEIERKNEKKERELMNKEEINCKNFYRAELKLNNEERWKMRQEELEMKEFLRQEQMSLMKSKYDIAGDEEDRFVSAKINRREEVKRLVAERQKRKVFLYNYN